MSETISTPTPTPTEPHHDAVALAQRLDALSYDLMVGGQDNAHRSTLALSGIPDMRRAANLLRDLAAVSAAAPVERATDPLIVSAIRRHPSGTLRYEPANGPATGTSGRSFLAEYDAALAARPAPVVSDLLPAESIALTVALAQVQRGDDPSPNVAGMCVLALARLAGRHDWTVADAPAAEPEYSERDNACGYCGRVHGDLAACGPAADNEGGRER
jgi:hypothetical protein